MRAQLSCRFDLAGLCVYMRGCVSVCVLLRFSRPVSCILAISLKPESINLTIPVLGSDLNVWVTRLHRASFFSQHKDVLSRLGDSMEMHNSQLNSSVCKTTNHQLTFTCSTLVLLRWLGTRRDLLLERTATCLMTQRTFQ